MPHCTTQDPWWVLAPGTGTPTLQIPVTTSQGLHWSPSHRAGHGRGQKHTRDSGGTYLKVHIPRAKGRAQVSAGKQQQVFTSEHLSGQALGSAHCLLLLWLSVARLASLQISDEAVRCILG